MTLNSIPELRSVRVPLETGMSLAKCRQCGCMSGTLSSLSSALATLDSAATQALAQQVSVWRS